MSTQKKGRPQAENPKNIQVKFRADQQFVNNLNYCCDNLKLSKSDVLRLGVQKVMSDIRKEK